MASTSAFRLSIIMLALFLGCCHPGESQEIRATLAAPAQSNSAATAAAESRCSLPTQDADGDFRKRVEARWNAARMGQIEARVMPDPTDHDIFKVHVVITRAPAGSDGMKAATPSGGDSWSALLKLDDEEAVGLSPGDLATFDIQPHETSPDALIRHLDSGGHAEWTWTIRRTRPGVSQILLEANVVYRRNFSPGGQPVVTCHSAQRVLSLP